MRGNASVDARIKVLFDTHAECHFRVLCKYHYRYNFPRVNKNLYMFDASMENALLRCGYDSKEVAKLRFTVIDRRKKIKK